MFARMRRRAAESRRVSLCESCGQACTSGCRGETRFERTRTTVIHPYGFIRWRTPVRRTSARHTSRR